LAERTQLAFFRNEGKAAKRYAALQKKLHTNFGGSKNKYLSLALVKFE